MTQRQEAILKTIVEYYVQTANPVGSIALARQFGLSSATIRAEMAVLERTGYITHPHTSAGRIPTDQGYRHYVESLQSGKRQLDAGARVRQAIDRRIANAGEPQSAIKLAVNSLSQVTGNLGVATMGAALYMYGFANLFAQPEFEDNATEISRLLDGLETWLSESGELEEVTVYIGQENPIGKSSGCALIITAYDSPYSPTSYIGVLGPTRQSYSQVINLVKHVGSTLEEVLA